MKVDKFENYNDTLLIDKFNEREDIAFSKVYVYIYNKLYFFTERIFINTNIYAQDVFHDIFISIWCNKYRFATLKHIENYIYQSIKNKHKDFLKQNVFKTSYSDNIAYIDAFHFSQIVETEVFNIINETEQVLTPSCADVMKLYLEGYDIKEISKKLDKSQYTIYHQKSNAIKTLKKYFIKKKIVLSLLFLVLAITISII